MIRTLEEKMSKIPKRHQMQIQKIMSRTNQTIEMADLLARIYQNDKISQKGKDIIIRSLDKEMEQEQSLEVARFAAYSKIRGRDIAVGSVILSEATGAIQASHARSVLEDERIIEQNLHLVLARLISKSHDRYQSFFGAEVAKNEIVQASGEAAVLTKIACETESYFQAMYTALIETNEVAHASGQIVPLAIVISKSISEAHAKKAISYATNRDYIIRGEALDLAIAASGAKMNKKDILKLKAKTYKQNKIPA